MVDGTEKAVSEPVCKASGILESVTYFLPATWINHGVVQCRRFFQNGFSSFGFVASVPTKRPKKQIEQHITNGENFEN